MSAGRPRGSLNKRQAQHLSGTSPTLVPGRRHGGGASRPMPSTCHNWPRPRGIISEMRGHLGPVTDGAGHPLARPWSCRGPHGSGHPLARPWSCWGPHGSGRPVARPWSCWGPHGSGRPVVRPWSCWGPHGSWRHSGGSRVACGAPVDPGFDPGSMHRAGNFAANPAHDRISRNADQAVFARTVAP